MKLLLNAVAYSRKHHTNLLLKELIERCCMISTVNASFKMYCVNKFPFPIFKGFMATDVVNLLVGK